MRVSELDGQHPYVKTDSEECLRHN
jgi:hypothetical protein